MMKNVIGSPSAALTSWKVMPLTTKSCTPSRNESMKSLNPRTLLLTSTTVPVIFASFLSAMAKTRKRENMRTFEERKRWKTCPGTGSIVGGMKIMRQKDISAGHS